MPLLILPAFIRRHKHLTRFRAVFRAYYASVHQLVYYSARAVEAYPEFTLYSGRRGLFGLHNKIYYLVYKFVAVA